MKIHTEEEDRHYLSATMLPNNEVWIAGAEDRTAGFIAFARGWINQLFVDPKHQRQGIGFRLLDVAKGSNETLRLWVL